MRIEQRTHNRGSRIQWRGISAHTPRRRGQLTKMLSLYLRFGAARGPQARTRPFGIDYFDLACDFLCRLFDGMRRFARTVDKRFLCNRRRFYRANSNSHKQRLRVSLGFVDTRAVKVKIGKRISAPINRLVQPLRGPHASDLEKYDPTTCCLAIYKRTLTNYATSLAFEMRVM
jgi:hypothetical protein